MMILALLAGAVHTLIIPRRGTSLAYLLGYGVVIPLSLALPFFLIEYLDVMGPFPKFGLFCIPTQTTFRCIEAMHGTSPPSVETSVAHYMTYYTCTMDFQWDPKTNRRVRITNAELARRNLELLWEFLCLSVVLSYLIQYDFKPFSSDMVVHHFGIGPELLSPHHVANTFLYAGERQRGLCCCCLHWNDFSHFVSCIPTHKKWQHFMRSRWVSTVRLQPSMLKAFTLSPHSFRPSGNLDRRPTFGAVGGTW